MIISEWIKGLVLLIIGKLKFVSEITTRDLTMLSGIALVGYGGWLFLPALGFGLAGIILLYISLWR